MQIIEPFILKVRMALPEEPSTLEDHQYDSARQLWASLATGIPLVVAFASQRSTRFGETSMTETREGADQSEVSAFYASRFGETQITKTFEGHDQTGEAILICSRFGETSVTATAEGHDVSECAHGFAHVANSHF